MFALCCIEEHLPNSLFTEYSQINLIKFMQKWEIFVSICYLFVTLLMCLYFLEIKTLIQILKYAFLHIIKRIYNIKKVRFLLTLLQPQSLSDM